ncbi:hypothetical protein PInf_007858 [Phytophthora infestans]|nr:hypothetical protein PInf_007858 [Phytophthora infestans]
MRSFTVGTKKVSTESRRQSVAAFSIALGADAELGHELYSPGFRRLLAGKEFKESVDKKATLALMLAADCSNVRE